MDPHAWLTISVIAAAVVAMASNRIGPDTAMLGALAALLVAGVFRSPADAFRGYADPSVIMIAALFVVAAGLTETGAMHWMATRLLGRPSTPAGAIARLSIPVAGMSATMNNTPIVAMAMPIVSAWARRARLSPSVLFMPLSFAAILGGMCTLIGTSTNVLLDEQYMKYIADAGTAARLQDQFGLETPGTLERFWRVAVVGLPAAVAGIAFMALFASRLVPKRRPVDDGDGEREYTLEMRIEPGSAIDGKTVEQAQLRHLPGLFLASIERNGEVIPAVGPDEVLRGGDVLVFAGILDSVVDLLNIRGLVPATDQVKKVEAPWANRAVVEAVISPSSPLCQQSIRQAQFRTRFNAAVIAVHRVGRRVEGKIGDIVLQPGDTLLLSTHRGFVSAFRNSRHFYLVSGVEEARVVRHDRAWVALIILGILVASLALPLAPALNWLFATLGWAVTASVTPVSAAVGCAVLMVLTRCVTGTVARRSLDWQVILVIGAAIGLGEAMRQSGAATGLADAILGLGLGPYGLLLAVILITVLLTQVINNAAAAVIMFEISMQAAQDADLSPEPFLLGLMAAASASFLTPIGYQTNLMVTGPGGYRFLDFLRLGVPMTAIVTITAMVLVPLVFPFRPI
ncbi:MAG: SLC13 family permease [Planctomycetota bacterium]